ncbi:MAG TPA: hypothetical protein VHM91_06365, partial [Verrucomicrobiales bacterium]|nr:hypothetical protein [Verrucomicrobiales bacterium]
MKNLRYLCLFGVLLACAPEWTYAGMSDCLATASAPTFEENKPAPCSLDLNGNLRTSGTFSGSISNADGAIVDGANATIKATVKDYTNSNPMATILVDTNGDPATVGGGTQYNQGTVSTTTDTMTMAGCVRVDTPAVASGVIDGDRARCIVDSTGRLWVHTGIVDTLTSITNPVAVTGTFWQATQPVSGTVTANAGTGNFTVTQATGTNLHVVCDSGCSSSAGFGDNGAFTYGTTAVNPIAGVLDDTSTNTATENSAAVARITAQKALHMNLRNNSGTEVGTSGAPLRTDPTGSTTQPVSGTVSITANSAVNIAQMNGVTTSMGVGASGTGTQRVASLIHDGTDTAQVTATSGGSLQVECTAGCSGSGGTSSNYGSAFPSAGTAAGFTDGTNMVAGRVVTSAPGTSDAGLVVRPISPASSTIGSAVPSVGVQVTGSDGTNARALATDTSGNVQANVKQINGVAPSMGNGISGTGVQRVTIASDSTGQVALASGSNTIGALTANQSVNVAQINGVATTMGNGVAGTGVQRVTIASDSTGTVAATQATAANLNVRPDTSGATGAAPPARANFTGGLQSGATGGFLGGFAVCDSFVNVNVSTATTTALITGVSGRHVRICGMSLVTAAANNVALISGTGATCGTGTTGMNGGTTAASGWNFAANGGLTQGNGL